MSEEPEFYGFDDEHLEPSNEMATNEVSEKVPAKVIEANDELQRGVYIRFQCFKPLFKLVL